MEKREPFEEETTCRGNARIITTPVLQSIINKPKIYKLNKSNIRIY